MARVKKPVHKVQMTDGKRNIIQLLLQEYDIQDALKDLLYVAYKDRKPYCADLKTIYQAPTEEKALEALERVTEKWNEKYPNSMRSLK